MGCAHHPDVEAGLERCERCGAELCLDCFVVLRDRPFCPACKVEHVRDLRSGIVPGALEIAGTGRRFLGVWLDGFITALASYAYILIPVMIAAGAAGASAGPGAGIRRRPRRHHARRSATGAMVSLIAVRFLMGIANAPVFPTMTGIIALWFPSGSWRSRTP